DPVFALGAQAQQSLAEGQTEEAHALALLASALQGGGSVPADPMPTGTPSPVPTRTLPVNTPTP
ncbi:MAG: cellulose-binding protein, partial [Brevefilum sp.]